MTQSSSSINPKALIAFCLGAGMLVASCSNLPKETADAQQRSPEGQGGGATAVDVAIARTVQLRSPIVYVGTTSPVRTVALRSKVEGQLLGLNADVGDGVKQGQIVAILDDTLLLTQLNQAEAELASLQAEVARAQTQVSNAKAQVERARLEQSQAQSDAGRLQRLLQAGAIAAQQAEQARTTAQTAVQSVRVAQEQVRTEQQAVAAAQGRVVAQRAVVAQAQQRRSDSRLISPINGVVVSKTIETGNLVQPGGEVLKLGDFSRMIVKVEVSELELSKIKIGQSVEVRLDAFPGQTFTGAVSRISPEANNYQVPVEVVIPNSKLISSSLLARVTFAGAATGRVVVPQIAVASGDSGRNSPDEANPQSAKNRGTLFVVTEAENSPGFRKPGENFRGEGRAIAVARKVTLGERADGKVEILSGLKEGERFVARSGKPLKDGETVRVSVISEQRKGNQ